MSDKEEALSLLAFLCVTKAGDNNTVQLLLCRMWRKNTGHALQSVECK